VVAIEVDDHTEIDTATIGAGELTAKPATPTTYVAAALSMAGIGVLAYLMFME
jgi:hypothetical protein